MAEVRLPKLFTDNMVLQQELPIRVWGWAKPEERIEVAFADQSEAAAADKEGRWRIELPAMKADGKAHELSVTGENKLVLKDVVLGEVWLAVGQSNMSRGLRYVKDKVKQEPMDFPDLRLFFVGLDQVPQREEAASTKGWAPASHESMNKVFVHPTLGPYEYSEVTYYFGKALHEKLSVPVGMISVAFPGSTAAQWTPAEDASQRFNFTANQPDKGPGSMYQAMLLGVPPLSLRGVIYYQGENDASNAHYHRDLKAMLAAWRAKFQQPELPLLMTQLGQTTFNGGTLHVTTVQQRLLAEDPHTGLAASNDLFDGGDPKKAKARLDEATGFPIVGGGDPHPPNKHVVAGRLARLALGQTYGQHQTASSGPLVDSFEARDKELMVNFKHVGTGLTTDNGESPNWFQLAGEDRKFVTAQAKIVGKDAIVLTAEGIPHPKFFRFAWHSLARHNLYNSEGLPAIANHNVPTEDE
jgi:sialate O-acetylesterase